MTSLGNQASHQRLRAPGFPVAPLIEAVIDIHFEAELSAQQAEAGCAALQAYYPDIKSSPQLKLEFDSETESINVEDHQTVFRGEGADPTEVVILRPEGLATSQLAPYRDWETFYARFTRDLEVVCDASGCSSFKRMAVRYINRVDVPPDGDIVRYEDYITVHPTLPAALDPLQDFRMQLLVSLEKIKATAKIIVGGYPQAAEGKASFIVDIDVVRSSDVPSSVEELEHLFAEFRQAKNAIYRACLTPKALQEFEE